MKMRSGGVSMRSIGPVLMVLSMGGCGGADSDVADNAGLSPPVPDSIRELKALNPLASSIDIALLIDPGTPQAQSRPVRTIVLDESSTPVVQTLDAIAAGTHRFQLEYRVQMGGASPSNPIVIALSDVISAEVKAGQKLDLVFDERNLDLSRDEDADGFSNLTELRAGTDPSNAALKPPIATPGPAPDATITAQNAISVATDVFYVIETVILGSVSPLFMLGSQTGACEFGGRLDVSFNDGDQNGKFSPGDSISYVASQCQARNPDTSIADSMTTNGTMVISSLAQSADTVAGTSQASWRISYDRYSIDDGSFLRTLNGVTTLATATSPQVEYISAHVAVFTFTDGNRNFAVPSSLSIVASTDLATNVTAERIVGSVSTTFGHVEIDTVEPLVSQGEGDPASGQLEFFTPSSALALVAQEDATNVSILVDSNGDGLQDATLRETWTNLGW